uniref:Uncharacterized protein n=1 Tax=Rhizophora mucronata TaxID=61149 RepID=A0A2P2NU76_RHIMU
MLSAIWSSVRQRPCFSFSTSPLPLPTPMKDPSKSL